MATKAYVRRSTKKQSMSLRGQVLYLLDLVEDLRKKDPSIEPLTFENVFIETKSGKDDEDTPDARKVFVAFRDSLKRDDLALFVHNDRLSRNTVVVLQFVHAMQSRGVRVIFGNLSGIDVSTPEGELMLTNFAGFSRYFLADLKRKTKIGLQAAKAEGKHSGPVPPFFEEADDNGQRVLRPTKRAFDIEMALQSSRRGAIERVIKKYLPDVLPRTARSKIRRFKKTMREWRKTGPWIRLREEEREKPTMASPEDSAEAVRAMFK